MEAFDQDQTDRDSLRRALRDLEAAEARVQRNADRVYSEVRGKLVAELLPVLDDLDRSLAAAKPDGDPPLVEAVWMVRAHLDRVLDKYGAERIDAKGQRFDPQIHDAIATLPVGDAAHDRIVVDQLQPGYVFEGRVLRPARVVVGTFR
ncbi:MAG: nucleotide exchange factor GrpE [Acidobacteriota bacterium]